MASYERQKRHDFDPRLLDRHLRGLRQTTEAIKDFRILPRIGGAALQDHARSHKKHRDFRDEFARAAGSFVEKGKPANPDEEMYASLLSVVPGMLKSRRTLEKGIAYGQQNYAAKMKMINFNDTLRTVADTHPSLNPEIVTQLVRSIALEYRYDAEDVNAAITQTEESSRGIKHELSVEAETYWLSDDFELIKTSAVDDKNGADSKILYRPTNVIVDIDVKASQEAARRAVDKEKEFNASTGHGYTMPPHKLIIYSGFSEQDFDPRTPWRATPAAIQREYPRLEALIRQAAGDNTTPVPQGVR